MEFVDYLSCEARLEASEEMLALKSNEVVAQDPNRRGIMKMRERCTRQIKIPSEWITGHSLNQRQAVHNKLIAGLPQRNDHSKPAERWVWTSGPQIEIQRYTNVLGNPIFKFHFQEDIKVYLKTYGLSIISDTFQQQNCNC